MRRVCVAGAGTIGSLFAAHLARVAEVSVLTRREEHAREREATHESGSRGHAAVIGARGRGLQLGRSAERFQMHGDGCRVSRVSSHEAGVPVVRAVRQLSTRRIWIAR